MLEARGSWQHPFADDEEDQGDLRTLTLRRGLATRPSDKRLCEAANRILSGLGCPELTAAQRVGRDDDGRLRMTYASDGLEPLGARLGNTDHGYRVEVLTKVCVALDSAHGLGVIHGALTPGSIRIGENASGLVVRVADFGLGHLFGSKSLLEDRARWLPYSPEKQLGLEPTPLEDVYLVGAVGYAMITGRPLFAAPTRSQTLRQHAIESPVDVLDGALDCEPWLCELLARCLRKEPDERYPTPGDVLAALRSNRKTHRAPPPLVPPPPRVARPPAPPAGLLLPAPKDEPADTANDNAPEEAASSRSPRPTALPPPPPPIATGPLQEDQENEGVGAHDGDVEAQPPSDPAAVSVDGSTPDAAAQEPVSSEVPPPEPVTAPDAPEPTSSWKRTVWPLGIAAAAAAVLFTMWPGEDDPPSSPTVASAAAPTRAPTPAPRQVAQPADDGGTQRQVASAPLAADSEAPAPPEATVEPSADDDPKNRAEREDTEDTGSDAAAPSLENAKAEARRLTREAGVARRSGDSAKAIRQLRRALQLRPQYAPAAHALGTIYFDSGDYRSAIRFAKRASRAAPRRSQYRLALGDYHYKAGDSASARAHWKRAAELGSPLASKRLAEG